MSKPSDRKAKKKRRRAKEKAAKQRAHYRHMTSLNVIPAFDIVDKGVQAGFASAVRHAAESVHQHAEEILEPHLLTVAQMAAKLGWEGAFDGVAIENSPQQVNQCRATMILALGEAIFQELPPGTIDSYLPFNDALLTYDRRKTRVTLRCLQTEKTRMGTAYFSPKEPPVEVPGATLIAAFSRHAAERICERTVVDWRTYGGSGDAFARLHDFSHYQGWKHGGQTGFKVYERCRPGFVSSSYAKQIGDIPLRNSGRWDYLLGYCPAVQHGRLLVAKTLLLPGMDGTPEHTWYRDHVGGDPRLMQELHNDVTKLSFRQIAQSDDFSLLRRFHENGIDQVVPRGTW